MTCKSSKGKGKRHLFQVAIYLWIYLPIVNLEIRCGKPGLVPFSTIIGLKETYQVGDEILYYCKETGDLISEPSKRICQINSTWSGRIPQCYRPVDIQSVRLSSLSQGLTDGATVDGNPDTCACTDQTEDEHHWEGYIPTSLDIRAVKVIFPENMIVSVEVLIKAENSDGRPCGNFTRNIATERSIELRCPFGTVGKYVHIRNTFPNPSNFCICEVTAYMRRVNNCLQPDIPWNGNGYQTVSKAKSEYTFSCNPGYELWGDWKVECLQDGYWNPPSPICKKITCDRPSPPRNGDVSYVTHDEKIPFNGTADYTCDFGYVLRGFSSLLCIRWNKWNHSPPVCEKNLIASGCGKLPQIANGVLVGNSSSIGSTASLKCNDGFRPISDTRARCQHTREWSHQNLHCAFIRCEDNPVVPHGAAVLLDNSTFFGSRLQILCNRGYVANSSAIRMCDQTATWGDLDVCIAITCGNVAVRESSFDEWLPLNGSNSVRYLKCPKEFHIEGSPPVTRCLVNGSWSYTSATCKETHWGSEWNPTVILSMAVAAGVGTAVCILCLAMSFIVIRKRRQSKTNTTVFHLGARDSTICNGGKKFQTLTQDLRYYPADPYEDAIELRQKPISTQSRKPRSALPHLPVDADPVYAQPFETASDLSKKVSTATVANKDDLYTAHIYAEPVDSRRPQSGNSGSNCVSETWFRTGTGKFGRKMSLPDCPATSNTTVQQNSKNSCAIYEPSCHSSPLNCTNTLHTENCQKTETEMTGTSDTLINNTIYLETSSRPRISLEQVQMINNDIYMDDYFSNA